MPTSSGHSSPSPMTNQGPTATAAEDEDARKSRINSELVQLLQTPSLPGRTASVQGFGVYTHGQIRRLDQNGDPQDTSEIMFLPVGGPNKVRRDNPESQAPMDEKVQKAWSLVEGAVEEEEMHLHERSMSLEKLKERYGALEVPENTTSTEPDAQLQQQRMRQWIEYLSHRASNAGQGLDDTTGSTRSLQSPSLARGNVYHEERDPRKR